MRANRWRHSLAQAQTHINKWRVRSSTANSASAIHVASALFFGNLRLSPTRLTAWWGRRSRSPYARARQTQRAQCTAQNSAVCSLCICAVVSRVRDGATQPVDSTALARGRNVRRDQWQTRWRSGWYSSSRAVHVARAASTCWATRGLSVAGESLDNSWTQHGASGLGDNETPRSPASPAPHHATTSRRLQQRTRAVWPCWCRQEHHVHRRRDVTCQRDRRRPT